MAIIPGKPTLIVLGLIKRLSGGSAETIHDGDSDSSDGFGIEDLVEAGEEVFDEIQTKLKDTRDRLGGDLRDGVRKLLADLGVATRDEIHDLREEIIKDNQKSEP